MVLDTAARPSGAWYEKNLDQNIAFQKRIGVYFQWIARHHRTYGLGKTRRAVAAPYAKARSALKAEPVDGGIGPAELDDLFLADGYGAHHWEAHARAPAASVVRRDPGPLRTAWP